MKTLYRCPSCGFLISELVFKHMIYVKATPCPRCSQMYIKDFQKQDISRVIPRKKKEQDEKEVSNEPD